MSDLSEIFGGSMNYSHAKLDEIMNEMKKIGPIRTFTVGKILVEMYKNEVDESRRESFPMEDWIKIQYNHYS